MNHSARHVCACRVVHFEDELSKEEEDVVMHEKRVREKVGPLKSHNYVVSPHLPAGCLLVACQPVNQLVNQML